MWSSRLSKYAIKEARLVDVIVYLYAIGVFLKTQASITLR